MPRATYLLKSIHGIFYFRTAIPKAVRTLFPRTSREYRKSLRLSNRKQAETAARLLWCQLYSEWNFMTESLKRIEAAMEAFEADLTSLMPKAPPEQVERAHAMLQKMKGQFNWLKERNLAHEINNVNDIFRLYGEYLPIFREAYRKHNIDQTNNKVEAACTFFENQNRALGTPNSPPAPATPIPDTNTISYVSNKFMTEKNRSKAWSSKTTNEYARTYLLFEQLLDNKPISQVTIEDMRDVKTSLLNLPANLNKMPQYKNMNLKDVLKQENENVISVVTFNQHVQKLSSLFDWANAHGYCKENLASKLKLSENKNNTTQREEFDINELNRIFMQSEFITVDTKRPHKFWSALLALFTGARVNEIAQLYIDDFVVIDGINCIRINDTHSDQSVKTDSSKRLIPIHSKLIELGILDFVEWCKNNKKERLFYELKLKRDGYGHTVSKWFGNFKNKIDLPSNGTKTFHGFRHTFINNLKQQQVAEPIVAALAGHSRDSITFDIYGKKYSANILKEAIEKLSFEGLELSSIKWPGDSRRRSLNIKPH